MTLTLSGLRYQARRPSYLELDRLPVVLAYDGQHWRISVHGAFGPRPFKTRDEATDLVAEQFRKASA